MLSGLFKRKDKRSKAQGDEDDSELLSKENPNQAFHPQVMSDATSQDGQSLPPSPRQQRAQSQRQISKLQKTPPAKLGPFSKRPSSREGQVIDKVKVSEPLGAVTSPSGQAQFIPVESGALDNDEKTNASNISKETPPSLRIITQSPGKNSNSSSLSPMDSKSKGGGYSPIKGALQTHPAALEPEPEKVKRAKERVAMDDFDSSPDLDTVLEPMQRPGEHDAFHRHEQQIKERLSESPIEVSPVDTPQPVSTPALVGDFLSQERPTISPVSRSSSPELIEAPREELVRDEETPASTLQSSTGLRSWSDASLRTYLEDDTDIRDLLIVVHDKSNIKPAGPDHPIVVNLCKEEYRKLGEMSTRLDGLLNDWWARRSNGVS